MFKSHFCRSQKYFEVHLRPYFNVVFNADSEFVFNFFLSCLELEKLKLKDLAKLLSFFILKFGSIMNHILEARSVNPIYTCLSYTPALVKSLEFIELYFPTLHILSDKVKKINI